MITASGDSDLPLSYQISPEFAYATLADGSVAAYCRESGNTHFLQLHLSSQQWAADGYITAPTLRQAFAALSSSPESNIQDLLRIGILVPQTP